MVNLLTNGDFNGPVAPAVAVGQGGPYEDTNAGWGLWNNPNEPITNGDALWTSAAVQTLADMTVFGEAAAIAGFKKGPDDDEGVNVAEIRTDSGNCGLFQYFDTVEGAQASVWVYVIEGSASAGLTYQGGDATGLSSQTTRAWEQITFEVPGTPIDEFVVYSTPGSGAWFYVAQAIVTSLPQPGP